MRGPQCRRVRRAPSTRNGRRNTRDSQALDLQRLQRQLRAAQRIAPLGGWWWDAVQDQVIWSPELCRILGVAEAAGPRSFAEAEQVIVPEDRRRLRKAVERAIESGQPFGIVMRVRRPDGELRVIEAAAEVFVDHRNRPTQVVGMCQDVTERRRAEEALTRSRAKLRDLAHDIENIRERERTRIARELHDELGQALTAMRLELAWLEPRVAGSPSAVRHKLEALGRLVETTNEALQRIAMELRPRVLDELGLAAAMHWQAGEFERRTGLIVRLKADPAEVRLDADVATAVFRILQEALTNVLRHADARSVAIRFRAGATRLSLVVRDDGKGIDPSHLAAPRSLGLLGMHERAAAWGGTVTVRGRPGRGTLIELRIPLPASRRERRP